MNKEDIIKRVLVEQKIVRYRSTFADAMRPAMEEYARQQAIAFGEFVDLKAVRNGFHEWTVGCGHEKKDYTSEQLYTLFLDSQTK